MDFLEPNTGKRTNLQSSEIHHLVPAEGWFELGNYAEAKKELDLIEPCHRNHLDVLVLRLRTCVKLSQWEESLELATAVLDQDQSYSDYWIKRSCSLHELTRTKEAYDLLKPALLLFPGEHVIPFNLNVYARALGRPLMAFYWRFQAIRINWNGVFESIDRTEKKNPKWQTYKARWKKRMRKIESFLRP